MILDFFRQPVWFALLIGLSFGQLSFGQSTSDSESKVCALYFREGIGPMVMVQGTYFEDPESTLDILSCYKKISLLLKKPNCGQPSQTGQVIATAYLFPKSKHTFQTPPNLDYAKESVIGAQSCPPGDRPVPTNYYRALLPPNKVSRKASISIIAGLDFYVLDSAAMSDQGLEKRLSAEIKKAAQAECSKYGRFDQTQIKASDGSISSTSVSFNSQQLKSSNEKELSRMVRDNPYHDRIAKEEEKAFLAVLPIGTYFKVLSVQFSAECSF